MPRLVFVVDVDDKENGEEYLIALNNAFVAVTNLNAWGYTQDELMCRSRMDHVAWGGDVVVGKDFLNSTKRPFDQEDTHSRKV